MSIIHGALHAAANAGRLVFHKAAKVGPEENPRQGRVRFHLPTGAQDHVHPHSRGAPVDRFQSDAATGRPPLPTVSVPAQSVLAPTAVNILEQINLRIGEFANGERCVTVNRPNLPFQEIFKALNAVLDPAKDEVVWQDTPLMAGPQDDGVSAGDQSFTIHFMSGDATRGRQATFLASRGQKFADPFLVAMAEAAYLAKTGKSLFQRDGDDYYIRTAVVKTAETVDAKGDTQSDTIYALFSHDRGVQDFNYYDGRHSDPYIVAAGSPA